MGALAIPVVYDEKAVLLADDEPEYLDWLIDFLKSLGLKVTVAVNVEQAMSACQKTWYRIYIIDLNIPLGRWPQPANATFVHYCGFSIIQAIRSQGNDGRRVIAYSAHTNAEINAEMKRLYTDFIEKDHAIQLKDCLRDLLTQPDQTAAALKRVRARMARKRAAADSKRIHAGKPRTSKGTVNRRVASSVPSATKSPRKAAPRASKPQPANTTGKNLSGKQSKTVRQSSATVANTMQRQSLPSVKPKGQKPSIGSTPGKAIANAKKSISKTSP